MDAGSEVNIILIEIKPETEENYHSPYCFQLDIISRLHRMQKAKSSQSCEFKL